MTDYAPHSAEWIDDSRLDWWSTEQLRSIFARHDIGGANRILDVGVGGGHWAAKLALVLDAPQDVTGVDFEAHWVAASTAYFRDRWPTHSYRAVEGQADALPFASDSFDIVTCQTVLMHCADPAAVLREMLRVLKPGGWLLLSEPMNHWNRMGTQLLLAGESEAARLGWKIWSAFRAQRIREGQGDNDIAATLPSHIAAMQAELLGCYQSEMVSIELATQMSADDYIAEYRKPDVIALLQRAGISPTELQTAEAAMTEVIEAARHSGITAFANPMPLLLFVARNPAA